MRSPLGASVLVSLLVLSGCQAVRMYAKDLLDPRASAAVSIPVKAAIGLFVLPPALVWLPVSGLPLLIFQNEPAVWFALAPGVLLGGPFVLLFGTPGYLASDPPEKQTLPDLESTAPVRSSG